MIGWYTSAADASKRLTKWNGKKWVLPQGRTADGESYWRIIAERLAAYENTGLDPDEILILINDVREIYAAVQEA